jgi:hypothetical protein
MKPLSQEARALLAAALTDEHPTEEERARALRGLERACADGRLAPTGRNVATPLATDLPSGPVFRRRGGDA